MYTEVCTHEVKGVNYMPNGGKALPVSFRRSQLGLETVNMASSHRRPMFSSLVFKL